jgi:hypothetical protein
MLSTKPLNTHYIPFSFLYTLTVKNVSILKLLKGWLLCPFFLQCSVYWKQSYTSINNSQATKPPKPAHRKLQKHLFAYLRKPTAKNPTHPHSIYQSSALETAQAHSDWTSTSTLSTSTNTLYYPIVLWTCT